MFQLNWSKNWVEAITINQLIQKVERSITFFFCSQHLDGMLRCWSFSSFPVPTTRSMWCFGTFQLRLDIGMSDPKKWKHYLQQWTIQELSCKRQVVESTISSWMSKIATFFPTKIHRFIEGPTSFIARVSLLGTGIVTFYKKKTWMRPVKPLSAVTLDIL